MDPKFAGKTIPASYGGDIDQMPETPSRTNTHHRRAYSETFFRFPDDILLDDFNFAGLDFSSLSPDPPLAAAPADSSGESSDVNAASAGAARPVGPSGSTASSSHFRSLSVDADFFDGLGFSSASPAEFGDVPEKKVGGYRHRHSNSMDGGSATSFDGDSVMMVVDNAKKALAPDRLAELSLIDPKRAKRILANRQSAARSKERKIRYTNELERKVQTLQTEATTLSAQVTMLQRDTTGLTSENKELKLRLQAMEQQAQLRDALNETLREEVQRLKLSTGQIPLLNGMHYNRSLPPQYPSQPQRLHQFENHQAQQPQQQQLRMPSRSPANGQSQPSSMDFN